MLTRPTHALVGTFAMAFVALCLASSPASSAVILDTAADTFTSAANQDTNYGSITKVNIENTASDFSKHRIGYFRFDLSSYTGGTVTGATFTLFPFEQISATPQNFDIYGITNGGASENFVESALTWNNSGYAYNSGQNITDSANFSDLDFLGTLTGVTQADEGGSVTFSSAALIDFLNNDDNNIVTFVVVNTNGTGSFNGFYSKENTTPNNNGSTLTVVPEPASAILVAMGILAASGRPRRR